MLNASSVTHRFGNLTAVQDLDLSVAPGELFCLLGANGAGKTTTINLFLGFLTPHWGTVTVGGIEPSVDPKAARRQLAYISENVALYTHLTGLENIRLFCQMGGRRLDDAALHGLLERSGLSTEQMNRRVSGYSKGMRQKVGLAIAYAREARALLLDRRAFLLYAARLPRPIDGVPRHELLAVAALPLLVADVVVLAQRVLGIEAVVDPAQDALAPRVVLLHQLLHRRLLEVLA